jgi:hypothetical protein
MSTVFPASDTDTAAVLTGSLGTFWSTLFPYPQQVDDTLTARLLPHRRTKAQLSEAIDAVSRKTIQPLHTEPLFRISILQSSLSRIDKPYTLDSGLTLDQGLTFDTGPTTSQYIYLYQGQIPDSVPVIQNRIKSPTRILVAGVDFISTGGRLHLSVDPFADPEYTPNPVYNDQNQIADYRIDLWGFQAQIDNRAVSKQVGYEIGFDVPSTINGRNLVNACMDMLVDGPTLGSFGRALTAMLDAPLAEGDEIVKEISTDRRGSFIATDKNVYRFSGSAVPLVSIGDTLHPGQALTNALAVSPLSPDSDLPYLAIRPSMVDSCYFGDVVFMNTTVGVNVSTVNNFTYVKWPLGGDAADVAAIFDNAQANGIARLGQPTGCDSVNLRGTIAQWLDQRVNPVGEPAAANLPATINPFRFLCENCLQGNAWLVKLRLASCGPAGTGLRYMAAIRQFLPKEIAIFFAVETSEMDTDVQTWLRDVTLLPAT